MESDACEADAPPVSRTRRAVRLAAAFAAYCAVSAVVAAPIAAEQAVEHLQLRGPDRLGAGRGLAPAQRLLHRRHRRARAPVLGADRCRGVRRPRRGDRARRRPVGRWRPTPVPASSARTPRSSTTPTRWPAPTATSCSPAVRHRFLVSELVAALAGGLAAAPRSAARTTAARQLAGARSWPGRRCSSWSPPAPRPHCAWLFARWEGSTDPEQRYAMPGIDALSFSSPQTLEVARQIQPFLTKNNDRIRARTRRLRGRRRRLARHRARRARRRPGAAGRRARRPRRGRPPGQPRRHRGAGARCTQLLQDVLGEDAVRPAHHLRRRHLQRHRGRGRLRRRRGRRRRRRPRGRGQGRPRHRHHRRAAQRQRRASSPTSTPTRSAASTSSRGQRPAFKTLFGGLVVNETRPERGRARRAPARARSTTRTARWSCWSTSPRPPPATSGSTSLSELDDAIGSETTPRDDGIPDLPPGIINVGHLHDAMPPVGHLEHRRRRDHLDGRQPARDLGRRGGEPHLQPLLHTRSPCP